MQIFIYWLVTLHVSGVHRANHQEYKKIVVTASGTDHTIWGASLFKRNQVLIWSCLKKLVSQIERSVPEAASTVLCTPDDGRDGRPKHVE